MDKLKDIWYSKSRNEIKKYKINWDNNVRTLIKDVIKNFRRTISRQECMISIRKYFYRRSKSKRFLENLLVQKKITENSRIIKREDI